MASPSPSSPADPGALDSFWAWSQTSLGSAIVGGIVVLLVGWIAAVIYKRASGKSIWPRMWSWIAGAVKWIGGLRLTTAARRESDIDRAKMKLQNDIAQAEGQILLLSDLHNRQRDKSIELAAELEAIRVATANPGPQPRWRLVAISEPTQRGSYVYAKVRLQNSIRESKPSRVRIDGNWGADVFDSGYWDQLIDGEPLVFEAKISEDGAVHGARFLVNWSDPSGATHSTTLELSPMPFY